jgi:hypothetical protein
MSSVSDPQPDPTTDEIVAYLDGELPPQECRRVENRLATDENYRQEVNELDRAWEALDVLPTPTVDDAFARTTIELACVAAEADISEHAASDQIANRNRKWWWVAAGVAAGVFGFLVGSALLPHGNQALLADLPAIHQLNVLPDVENVEFLRLLSAQVKPGQLVKDSAVYDRNLKELEQANSPSLETRRDWVESLTSERKAELADRTRAFNDLEPASGEREHMRQVMTDIRQAKDSTELQKTLVAYGQWLSRHTDGQQEQIREQMRDLPPEKQVAIIQKHIARDEEQPYRHLTGDDPEKLREEIFRLARERHPNFGKRMNRKGEGGPGFDEQMRQAFTPIRDWFQEKDSKKRSEIENQLVSKLSPEAREHWKKLEQTGRQFDKPRQMGMWIREAMDMRVEQDELEKFFADDKLTPERKQQLLDEPRARMDADLKAAYFYSKFGIASPGQWFGEFGESGRMRNGPGMGPRDGGAPNRPGFGPPRELRPEGPPPGERHQRRRPPGPLGGPPPDAQKQEAI